MKGRKDCHKGKKEPKILSQKKNEREMIFLGNFPFVIGGRGRNLIRREIGERGGGGEEFMFKRIGTRVSEKERWGGKL